MEELIAVGAQAFSVAVVGVVLPFALGTLGLMGIFHVDPIQAIFAGASMTATSIGITASVFSELGYLRTREGQIVIGAAVLDDILGIVILAVVVSLAAGGNLDIAPIVQLVVAAVLFVVVALVLSRKAAPAFDWVIDQLKAPGGKLVGSYLLLGAELLRTATAIGLEAALGAFAAGLDRQHLQAPPRDSSRPSRRSSTLFATVFFVLVGAGMDLSVINPSDPSARSALMIAGFHVRGGHHRQGGCRLGRVRPAENDKLVVGLGMLPRGEVGSDLPGPGNGRQAA